MKTLKPAKIVLLASLGAGLEYFDFTIFVLFASYMNVFFFATPSVLFNTFTTFALGYLVRPLGGIVWGHIGDKYGRKNAFTLSIAVMALATLCIGLIPSPQWIGSMAVILLVLFRLLQGFSVGGEIPLATVFTIEHLPLHRRGLAVGCIFMCITLGNTLASLTGLGLTSVLSEQQMMEWGWRIPFFLGFVLALISTLLRKKSLESPEFSAYVSAQHKAALPLVELLKHSKQKCITNFALTALVATTVFSLLYMPTYAVNFLEYDASSIYLMVMLSFLILGVLCAVFGWLSDYFSRSKMIAIGCVLTMMVSYPLFYGLINHTQGMPYVFGLVLVISVAMVNGCYALKVAESFNVGVRVTGLALCHNCGYAIFGGFMPMLLNATLMDTGDPYLPLYFLLLACVITLIACAFTLVSRPVLLLME